MTKKELEKYADVLKQKYGTHTAVARMLGWTIQHYSLVRKTGKVTPQAESLIKILAG